MGERIPYPRLFNQLSDEFIRPISSDSLLTNPLYSRILTAEQRLQCLQTEEVKVNSMLWLHEVGISGSLVALSFA